MRLLAIDSATERLALAAVDGGRAEGGAGCAVEALDLDGGAAASARALPALAALLAKRGWTYADLDAIAFGRGPGGFTGLRTACAVAQGLAFGQALPVVPVDSLAIVAEDAARQFDDDAAAAAPAEIWVLMDARMDEIYAGCYAERPDGGWRAVVEPALTTPGALNARWALAPPDAAAGSALDAFGDRLALGAARRAPRERARAAALGRLAAAGWARGETLPPDQALPIYLRDKVAQTTAEREAARAASARREGA
jgi:tRNA threonylcarbamoyladenosine biosynthesis protein TsaB